jgi:putative NADH-flavin reductase
VNIALIGASGYVGSALRNEALARGHKVTALVSQPVKLKAQDNLSVVKADVLDEAALAGLLRGHEAVLSAFSGHAQADVLGYYLRGFRSIIAAVKNSGVPRLLVVAVRAASKRRQACW